MTGAVLVRGIHAAGVTAALVLLAAPASATPNMIRLGYPTCSSCHLSPQGGGLLTNYGRGIDAAQTLRPVDLSSEAGAEDQRLLPYDMKFSLGVDRDPPAAAGYSFSSSARAALAVSHRQYIVYGLSVGSPTLARTRTSGAVSVRMSKLYWLYQPKDGVSFTVGRDDLPSGSGLLGFSRATTSPNVSSTPTQAKVFLWNKRYQVTAYGFGPDGNETDKRYEARGGGAIFGMNVWKDRAVAGVTSRVSYADAYDRRNAGAFLRLGLTDGVLNEFFQRAGFADGAIVLVDRGQNVEFSRRNDFDVSACLLLDAVNRSDVHWIGHRNRNGIALSGNGKYLVFPGNRFRQCIDDIGINRKAANAEMLDSGSFCQRASQIIFRNQVELAENRSQPFARALLFFKGKLQLVG